MNDPKFNYCLWYFYAYILKRINVCVKNIANANFIEPGYTAHHTLLLQLTRRLQVALEDI